MKPLPDWKTRLLSPALAACALLFGQPAQAGWPPPSFEAVYEIYMDGKPRMQTQVRFTRDGDRWKLENSGEGTKGLARMLRASSTDSASGRLDGAAILTAEFQHESRVAGRTDRWTARFDWDAGRVLTEHEEGQSELPLEPGIVDPMGLTLALQYRLSQQQSEWEQAVVEEDEIDRHLYRAAPPEQLQTTLGCLDVIGVERVRENSKRYSTVWFAPELDFVTIRMLHGKRGSHEFEMHIRELTLNGQRVQPGADCPAGG
jgi:hypothetical protein